VSAHRFIDSATGEYKSTLPELLVASVDKKCSDLAFEAYRLLVSDSYDASSVSGISAVWLDGNVVRHVGNDVSLSDPFRNEEIEFVIENAN
jgi:hypothetical protein